MAITTVHLFAIDRDPQLGRFHRTAELRRDAPTDIVGLERGENLIVNVRQKGQLTREGSRELVVREIELCKFCQEPELSGDRTRQTVAY